MGVGSLSFSFLVAIRKARVIERGLLPSDGNQKQAAPEKAACLLAKRGVLRGLLGDTPGQRFTEHKRLAGHGFR